MDNKYYTPGILEFRVGFEVEVKHNDGSWNSMVYTEEHLKAFMFERNSLEEGNIRVQYPTTENITACGFILDIQRGMIWGSFKGRHHTDEYYLEYVPYNNKGEYRPEEDLTIYKRIHNPSGLTTKEVIFKGLIKNISELRVLLKQLRIIDDK